ncbi:hypothetical protein CLOM_g15180 [Closterium sp. NIES-68]|nr:hypothetical protein CLOM_g15180 [Closterium sp. NIES-68]GJP73027.1 hypothetical protein CLOP_g3786 [Closterium sp. NIES-67]
MPFLRAARRPEVQPPIWFAAFRACCSVRRITCLFFLYVLTVLLLYEIGGVGHMCPADLSCEYPTEGMFWDHPMLPRKPPRVVRSYLVNASAAAAIAAAAAGNATGSGAAGRGRGRHRLGAAGATGGGAGGRAAAGGAAGGAGGGARGGERGGAAGDAAAGGVEEQVLVVEQEEEEYVVGGHLLVQETGEGPEKPESCVELCGNVPDCAFWMYDMGSEKGYCKLWAADQNPCEPREWVLLGRAAHFAQRWLVRNRYVVGGYCRTVETMEEKRRKRNAPPPPPPPPEEEEEEKRMAEEDVALETNECPKLTCNTVTRGYMFDHEGKGHFNFTYTGVGPSRPHTCYLLCRKTLGCAFWMYNMRSKRGACKMWTREQNPCEPTDAFDSTTAHYVAKRPTGSFVIGGNCDKLPPMKGDAKARQAQMAQQQQVRQEQVQQ